ncbi:AAA family ATPase [Paenibacillus sp. FSL R7-0331]|uniref:AAA family ATPase n=1 Tax=Paenibacillus sp. FSL R7-0331 TaxID=1536773 RepID=UPI0018CD86B0|nr:AAA family ATPase [Paenibacillus sp. FSL R7-0331]
MTNTSNSISKKKEIILVTGMSGTDKSTALDDLAHRGHRIIDTDYEGWSENVDGSGWFLHENRINELLTEHSEGTLFISGCVSNQGKFYQMYDAVVLLSALLEVILERVAFRKTNNYGKTVEQREEIIQYVASVEPLLRAGATVEIDQEAA